jgi:hypothetical protein
LLTAEAMLHASDGESEKAAQAILAAGRVADSIAEEPTVISHLVRNACWAIICPRLEHVVSVTSLTEDQLSALQKAVSQAERPQALARSLAGERACVIAMFADRKMQTGALTDFSKTGSQRWQQYGDSLLLGLYRASGLWQTDRGFYLDTMASYIEAAEGLFPERHTRGQQIGQNANSAGRLHIFSRMLLPALSKLFLRDTEFVARIRTTETALAVERFRRAHNNALPASLAELVPAYLPSVPTDPFDGKSLRFRKRDAGYVVYSIGLNGKDDDGTEPNLKLAPKAITFILEK